MKIVLNRRLTACAELVRKGARVCDIGTDHGHLPCYLVQAGLAGEAIAADVNEAPLARARQAIADCGLDGQVSAVLSDGLREIDPAFAEDIIVAGMGGELILKIVTDSLWLRSVDYRLVLQPMTNASRLREGLYRSGFEILKEVPVYENNHYYCVMSCCYSGVQKEISPLYSLIGKIPESTGYDRDGYLAYQAARMRRIAAGLRQSGKERQKAVRHETFAEEIEMLIPGCVGR